MRQYFVYLKNRILWYKSYLKVNHKHLLPSLKATIKHFVKNPFIMKININDIINHRQVTDGSCIPMAVECILKLLHLMPESDFPLQNDPSKSGKSDWIHQGFSYPNINPKVTFSREFFLPDIGMKDRGPHFMKDYFDPLFNRIDEELINNRFVIISLQSAPTPTQWHMEVIFDKVNDDEYQTVTFYHNTRGPVIHKSQNLKQRVTDMEGTDIITFRFIK